MKDLTKGSPVPLILTFTIPVLLGNLLQLLYNLADTRIVGSFLGEQALAAVGATNPLNNLLIGLLVGLTNGFAILTARCFGAKDRDGVRRSIGAIFVLAGITAIALTVVGLCLLNPSCNCSILQPICSTCLWTISVLFYLARLRPCFIMYAPPYCAQLATRSHPCCS